MAQGGQCLNGGLSIIVHNGMFLYTAGLGAHGPPLSERLSVGRD
jgi:hypothetical protein